MKKLLALTFSCFLAATSMAQDQVDQVTAPTLPTIKLSYLDSLKSTFVNHQMSQCIDERWLKEMATAELSNEMYEDIAKLNLEAPVDYDLDKEWFIKKLKKLDAQTPFIVEYNPLIENTVKVFLKNRSKSIERQMAIASYYFPMFEEYLAKYNLPLEIKYLAIVESALNPKAKSRVGAGGLWQFMPATGKQYKLDISSYIDERHDPIKATEAMCHYMQNMFAIFGDWSLVLASYNCGPGNVSKAIRRSGGSTDYWMIRKYLPKETANYVPAFMATMFIYEHKNELGLKAHKPVVSYVETDTVAVKKGMSFKRLAELLDISEEQIAFFNPTYSKNHIPSYENELYYLRLPNDKIGIFVSNEDKIYAYLDYLEQEKVRKYELAQVRKKDSIARLDSIALADNQMERIEKPITKEIVKKEYHKIKKGETLSEIADANNVSIADLRKWNKIKGNGINAGQSLVIQTKKKITTKEVAKRLITKDEKPLVEDNNLVENKSNEQEMVSTDVMVKPSVKKAKIEMLDEYYVVKKGDSIFSITKQFPNLTVEELKKKNNLKNDHIQPGMKLKIQG